MVCSGDQSITLGEGSGIRRGQSEEGTGNSVTSLQGALSTEDLELTPLMGEREKRVFLRAGKVT